MFNTCYNFLTHISPKVQTINVKIDSSCDIKCNMGAKRTKIMQKRILLLAFHLPIFVFTWVVKLLKWPRTLAST